MSKFLSEDWAQDVTTALSNHDGFKNALGAADLGIQFEVEDGPDGGVNYYLSASGGNALMALGDLDDADVNGGTLDCLTAGLSWYLNPNTRFTFNQVLAEANDQFEGNLLTTQMRMGVDF